MHVDAVNNGKACDCICLECGDPLEAHNNGKIKAHHYKHTSLKEGRQCLMTQLHRWAQEYISEKTKLKFGPPQIEILGNTVTTDSIDISVNNAILEKSLGKYRTDVYIETSSEPLVIEIKVSHACTSTKIDYFKAHKIPSVEIDLSQYVDMPIKDVKPLIDQMSVMCRWFYIPDQDKYMEEHQKLHDQKIAQRRAKIRVVAHKLHDEIISGKEFKLPKLVRRLKKERELGFTAIEATLIDSKTVNLDNFARVNDTEHYIHITTKLRSRPLHFVAQYAPDLPMPNIPISESVIKLNLLRLKWEWYRNSREMELAKKIDWPDYVTGRLRIERP